MGKRAARGCCAEPWPRVAAQKIAGSSRSASAGARAQVCVCVCARARGLCTTITPQSTPGAQKEESVSRSQRRRAGMSAASVFRHAASQFIPIQPHERQSHERERKSREREISQPISTGRIISNASRATDCALALGGQVGGGFNPTSHDNLASF